MTETAAPGVWAGRRVLVTGAAGFIGSHLTERLLAEGAAVRALVRYNSRNDHGWLEECDADLARGLEIYRGDLVNPEAVAGAVAGTSVVFHLGALIPIPYSYTHPREFVETNVVGTLNVLEAARRAGVERVVHTSTSEVYGTAARVPIDEDHPLSAQSPYAATKIAADQLAGSYTRSFGTPVVVARPFNTFGPRQSARAVIPTIISQALERDVIELGATETTRDFLFVDDTVTGMLRCGEATGIEGETINLGTGHEVAIADVVTQVLELVGGEQGVRVAPDRLRPDDSEVLRLVADAGKARRLLGWEPSVDLETGLQRTVDWIREHPGVLKASVYNV